MAQVAGAGCEEFRSRAAAGFTGEEVVFTHRVADGLHGAIVRSGRPADAGCCYPAGRAGCCGPEDGVMMDLQVQRPSRHGREQGALHEW